MDPVTQDYSLRDASMALAQAKTPFEKLEALNKESRALGIVIRHSGHGHGCHHRRRSRPRMTRRRRRMLGTNPGGARVRRQASRARKRPRTRCGQSNGSGLTVSRSANSA